jgi:hypothetical protein
MTESVECPAAPAAAAQRPIPCPACARLLVRIAELESRLETCHERPAAPVERDRAAALREKRAVVLAGLGRYTCAEVAAGESDSLLRELDAVNLALGRLPQIEQHAERMGEVARTGGLLLLAKALDDDLPGNTISAWLRAQADGL